MGKVLVALLMFALLAAPAHAFIIKTGETKVEYAAGIPVTVSFIGLNTEQDAGSVFLAIDGKTYLLDNSSGETIGDLKVSVTKVDIFDNQSGGLAYITLFRQATCADGVRNQDESDIDCGGLCPSCGVGKACAYDYQCASKRCDGGSCAPDAFCSDGRRSSLESDIDCGGSCGPCPIGKTCQVGKDCVSGNCQNGKCAPRSASPSAPLPPSSGIISVRNTSTFCGMGCFFVGKECVCPSGKPVDPPVPANAPSQNVSAPLPPAPEPYSEVITRTGKLFGFIPVTVQEQVFYDGTGKVIRTQRPRWAVFVR